MTLRHAIEVLRSGRRPSMEAMGLKGAKTRASEPPSDRLATLLRPIARDL